MSARRHMYEFGTTIEQLAEIAVSTRYNAWFNPLAYYRDPITIEDVQSSRMIADPLTKLHCCIRSDGGGAIVLTSEERARDCRSTPIWVLGTGEAISHTTMSEWTDFTESPCVRSGKKAFGSGRGHPRRDRCRRGLRLVHPDGAPHLRGPRLLQEGRGRSVRRGRDPASRRSAPDQHRRRGALVVPARNARDLPARRGRDNSSGASAGTGRSPTPAWRASTRPAVGSRRPERRSSAATTATRHAGPSRRGSPGRPWP